MAKKKMKVAVIGFDAPLTPSLRKYMAQGKLPAIKKLVDAGVWAENCLVPHPTITPPNWTAIATGATPGTHGITDFEMPSRDGTLGKTYSAFDTADTKAEFFWEAAERAGKKAIVLNYPASWPPRMKRGVQVGGRGLHVTENRFGPGMFRSYNVAHSQCVATARLPEADVVETSPANGWTGPVPAGAREATAQVGRVLNIIPTRPVTLHFLIDGAGGRVTGHLDKNAARPVFTVERGKWSETATIKFDTDKGKRAARFMVKCEELSDDGAAFKLYFTSFCGLRGQTFPAGVASELERAVTEGLPIAAMPHDHLRGWISADTWLEIMDIENRWLAEAARYLLTNKPWDVFFMHNHAPDHIYHAIINKIDPAIEKDPQTLATYTKVEEGVYISLDRMLARILDVLDKNTVVALVSDHGATPGETPREGDDPAFNINKLFVDAGLSVYQGPALRAPVWEKCKAVRERSCHVYVNLKSRYPHGIVEDKDYEAVRNEIIHAILSFRHPKTGRHLFPFAFRREEARLIGLHGPRIGDVIFGSIAEAPGEHGRHLSSGEYGIGSMHGLLALNGPGVKKGLALERTCNIIDLVPTLCYLAGLPVPAQCEGAVLYQALEKPDGGK